MLLQEKAQYELYKNKIDKVTFDKLCDADPSNGKYDVWIVNNFLKYFPAYCRVNFLYTQQQDVVKKEQDVDKVGFELNPELVSLKKEKNTEIILGYRYLNEDLYKVTEDLTLYDTLKRKNKLPPILKVGINTETGKLLDYHMAVMSYDEDDKPIVVKEKDSKNIMNFPSFGYLADFLADEIDEDTLAHLEDESKLANDIEVIYPLDEKGFWCGIPHTYEADRKLGRGTRWCTAADSDSGRGYFESYSKDGPLIVIFGDFIEESADKTQIHLESDQWMDAQDSEISGVFDSREKFISYLPPELVKRLREKTNSIWFLTPKEKESIYNKVLSIPDTFSKIVKSLQGMYFNAIIDNDETKHFSDIVGDHFLKMGAYDIIQENDDDSPWSYGYNRPWEYLDSEPEGELPDEEEQQYAKWKEDPDVWSDEQREEAGEKSETAFFDYNVKQYIRDIDYHWANRSYKEQAEAIWDHILANFITMGDEESTQFLKNQFSLLVDVYPDDMNELLQPFIVKLN
jgi:hypothetical protein